MEDLCVFINRADVPPLMQAAVVHAQFENVHPFADGNGRVGRCLIHRVLRCRGLAPSFVPPISVVLAARRDTYFAGPAEFRDGEVEPWLSFFADVTAVAAREAEQLSADINAREEDWLSRLIGVPDKTRRCTASSDCCPHTPYSTFLSYKS
jgi:Fic family protein